MEFRVLAYWLQQIAPYLAHKPDCWTQGKNYIPSEEWKLDQCTCGLKELKEKLPNVP